MKRNGRIRSERRALLFGSVHLCPFVHSLMTRGLW